jgi:hypothetical protein
MTSDLQEAVAIRAAEPGDFPFVLDGWIRSWRTSPWAGCIPNNMIWEVTRSCVAGLMTRGARLDVAEVARTDGTKRLVGFVCFEAPDLVHYVFVKKTGFRGFGIGRLLLDHASYALGIRVGRYTHRTQQSHRLFDASWTWDPISPRKEKP